MSEIADLFRSLLGLGLDGDNLGALQMGVRATLVYVVTVAIVRLGKKRFLGSATAFDMILGIMLGSIVSRAITGNAPLVPALAAAAALITLHSALSAVAYRWHRFGEAIKGHARVIVRDGRKDETEMRAAHLTERDLEEDFRRHGITSIENV